ncbi:MAG: DUF58 domain-containing protein [Ignavibacteriales bacterium]|nr:DUF58 domain-containing protein [Ignavibacteriales bacterium]
MTQSLSDYKKYFDPEVLSRVSNMELRARLVVEGFITGLHHSPYHGFSVEFAQHRQYMPGDEIKRIDWKIFGKTDRYYVKQFEEETNLKCYLVLDASNSMAFRSEGKISKLEYGSFLASTLAYLMVRQQDAVGLTIFDEQIRTSLSPHATTVYLVEIFKALSQVRAGNKTGTARSLHTVAERIKRRGLVIILSDLFDTPADVLSALKHFRHKRNEVILFHILDPLEKSFAFGSDAVFRDMETSEELITQPHHIRKAYQEAMREFIAMYKRECREHSIDYVLLDTATPFNEALMEYLQKRQRLH